MIPKGQGNPSNRKCHREERLNTKRTYINWDTISDNFDLEK